ncbi:MAG: DoxX family protein [Candidatus Eremiobacteraeota bacterium]|nr:DoxX family protein [Candidatus Eremiobacteraeota bacterium]MCW5866830.1 DoxX family protein [Candidatus Eremiobacteraeota bacterium]
MFFMHRWQPEVHALLRIVLGFLFACHGAQKLLGLPHPPPNGTVELLSFMGFAGALELVGGLMIMVGLFTRPVAFLLSGMMAVAYFMAHQPQGALPITNKGEPAVLYCFAFFFLSAAGGGLYSLDAYLERRKLETGHPSADARLREAS